MTSSHDKLTDLPEAELVWLANFADALRARDPRFAADDAGYSATEVARGAREDPQLRCLSAREAADRWLAAQPDS